MTDLPTLVACSHGTSSPLARQRMTGLVDAVARALPGIRVVEMFVDVEEPRLADSLPGIRGPVVVVPVFLSGGYHLHHDIHGAVNQHHDAVVTAPLGPDPRLAELQARRLAELGTTADDVVVMAASASSDARAVADISAAADLLRRPRPPGGGRGLRWWTRPAGRRRRRVGPAAESPGGGVVLPADARAFPGEGPPGRCRSHHPTAARRRLPRHPRPGSSSSDTARPPSALLRDLQRTWTGLGTVPNSVRGPSLEPSGPIWSNLVQSGSIPSIRLTCQRVHAGASRTVRHISLGRNGPDTGWVSADRSVSSTGSGDQLAPLRAERHVVHPEVGNHRLQRDPSRRRRPARRPGAPARSLDRRLGPRGPRPVGPRRPRHRPPQPRPVDLRRVPRLRRLGAVEHRRARSCPPPASP